LWLEEAASPLARACPREAARRPSRPPWPARSPSCACWCRRPPRRRSAWRAASVGRSARPAAEPPPLPARNRARPPRGPPAPAGPPPRRSRRARWPARPPRRRGALRRPRRRGPGVCPTRDGGRRLLHAERHRHESQGGRDQGVSRRRALCCSPSTCSRGADMRRQDVSVCGLRGPSQGPRAVARDDGGRCESRSRGWGPAYWASTARASTTSGRPWGTLRPSPALCRWRPAGAALSPPSPYIGARWAGTLCSFFFSTRGIAHLQLNGRIVRASTVMASTALSPPGARVGGPGPPMRFFALSPLAATCDDADAIVASARAPSHDRFRE
ncbi:unnamed protein product, partial [Prorocentrum cordatum]